MLTQTFFNQLEIQTEILRQQFKEIPIIERCLQGDIDRQSYINFLIEAYHHVKHTVPLLMACGSRLPERLEWLREALGEYIDEEMGHQEWILNDLESLGVDKEKIRLSKPAIATDLMVSYAYDQVMRKNPVGFFAMVYTLEKTSSTIATFAAEQIAQRLSLTTKSMSYLISHGSLDIKHMQHFELLMNRLDDKNDQQAVLDALPAFYQLYSDIFKTLDLNPQHSQEVTYEN